MADFDDLRTRLRQARDAGVETSARIRAVGEQLKRIDEQLGRLERVAADGNGNDGYAARRRALEQERRLALATLERLGGEHRANRAGEAELLGAFTAFTDPRRGIGRLDDATPILMMPVRVETRFKKVPGREGGDRDELWVRVFPDDCWVDSFDPSLSETELTNTRSYWTAIWQAGGIPHQERGAWTSLATAHGSGRASWLVEAYQPANVAEQPAKISPDDVILTVVTETAVPDAETPAIAAYWTDLWRSDGDQAASAAANAALVAAVGQNRAEEIRKGLVPANFGKPVTGDTAAVAVTLAFLVLPPADTRQSAWARAPEARILPDRFVFIGYERSGDPNPVVEVGRAVPSPLTVGPDPAAPKDEQLRHDSAGNLVIPDAMQWMVDFEQAEAVGMAMRVPLTPAQAARGFDRVLVLGVRLSADATQAQTELETLLRHHSYRRTGIALVPQGTPTNNTEAAGSGFDRLDDPDESFDLSRTPVPLAESGWLDKKDGQWLAEYLGVDPALFAHTPAAGAEDQSAARAMNTALWPATLGYWMETMMSPVFGETADATRDFFTDYVVAGGACPAIRIGQQPYGILPTTVLSRMDWLAQEAEPGPILTHIPRGAARARHLAALHRVLVGMQADFQASVPTLPHVGAVGDPHATLLGILGLHPGSVEWSQRYAESLKTLHNRLNLLGLGGLIQKLTIAIQRVAARQKLTGLGYTGAADPKILDLVFSGRHNLLTGGVVDDVPLSESQPVRAYTAVGKNYLEWLIDAANTSLDALYAQEGFVDDKRPAAILFLLLRHALQLGYSDVSIRMHENAGLYTPQQATLARGDDPFLHVRDNRLLSESLYQPLYAAAAEITGSASTPVHEFIGQRLRASDLDFYLTRQTMALNRLKGQPTAVLERAFADHVDLCSYRLDGWLLGLVNYQLAGMRNLSNGGESAARRGIHLGGYAWLEELRPDNRKLTPVELDDELAAVFAGGPQLLRDSSNQGFVHTPSLNHAVAAAVLRNGFLSDASPANRQTLAVNLTSERVRSALGFIEGIREGQSLSALLGYQFERGLHDRHGMAEVDKFILKLRKEFPLRADRITSTKTGDDVPIEAIEARNVLNGLSLIEHMTATKTFTYPFGKASLPGASTAEAAAINAEADRLRHSHDAVADLALSEGVYQAVLGNYDRVASTYDAYARGNFPPEPDVVRTPLSGTGLTHRVALHLKPGQTSTSSPVSGIAMTPRAQAEPALNAWLAGILPPLDQVGCLVGYRSAATGAAASMEVTLDRLGLQPADLLAVIRDDAEAAMSELDDRLVRFAVLNGDPRPDVPVSIEYLKRQGAKYSVFECMPLARNLRRLTMTSRPLRPTDLSLMNESNEGQDAEPSVDKTRLDAVRASLQVLRGDLAALAAGLDGPLGDLPNRREEILTGADTLVDDLATLLARTATHGVPQAGWGFAYDFRRRVFTAMLDQAAGLVERWGDRLAEFDAKVTAAGAAATDEEKFELLLQAERAVSTGATTPLPATPALFEAQLVNVTRPAFQARRNAFDAIRATGRRTVSGLRADLAALLPVDGFDPTPFTLTAREDEVIRFAQDARQIIGVLVTEADRRLAGSKTLFEEHDGTALAAARADALERAAKVLLGEDFRIFPEFRLASEQADEIENATAASDSGALFRYLTTPPDPARAPVDFPVDDWLYGVARVRDKLHAWEQTVMFAGALGRAEPELRAIQLPHIPADHWLCLDFPPETKLDRDRLLYTAHHAAAFDKTAPQCGMLLDEWTETIPIQSVDTGISFQYDRPNTEAPQTMLLVTPNRFRGAWQWNDLVDALNETLDLAKRRAVEPVHLDASPYAPFLPATVLAHQVQQLTIAVDLALNNKIASVGD